MNLRDVLLHPDEYEGVDVAAPWRPVVGPQPSVLHVSVFGNLFLHDEAGHVLLLDSWSGNVLGVSAAYDEYKARVATDAEFFRSWFLTELVELLTAHGMTRGARQVFAPLVSPALGGRLTAQNFSLAPLKAYIATSAAEALALRGTQRGTQG